MRPWVGFDWAATDFAVKILTALADARKILKIVRFQSSFEFLGVSADLIYGRLGMFSMPAEFFPGQTCPVERGGNPDTAEPCGSFPGCLQLCFAIFGKFQR